MIWLHYIYACSRTVRKIINTHFLTCFICLFRPSCPEQSPPSQGSPEVCHCHRHQSWHLWHEDPQNSERRLLQEEEAEEAPSPGGRDLWYRKRGKLTWMLPQNAVFDWTCSQIYIWLTGFPLLWSICRSTSWQSRGRRTRKLLMHSSCPSSRKYPRWKDTCALPSACLMGSTHTSWFSKCVVIKSTTIIWPISCLVFMLKLGVCAWPGVCLADESCSHSSVIE